MQWHKLHTMQPIKKGQMVWLYPQNYCHKGNLKQAFILFDLLLFSPKMKSFHLTCCALEEGMEYPGARTPPCCGELSDMDAGNGIRVLLWAVSALSCWAISPDLHLIILQAAFLLLTSDTTKWKFYDSQRTTCYPLTKNLQRIVRSCLSGAYKLGVGGSILLKAWVVSFLRIFF